ncbi:sodium- and chloride-dependent glycine transporter 1-like isoform X1 [Ptychodera flava]|uniref:sodium- and chloride-dependent glycine transporter 1-like isoform X1 n=1 Tax=Ptychodera flava TaxID=63121 RepID=UPI00396AA342
MTSVQNENIEMKERGQDVAYSGDENVERGNWSNKFEFLLSCLGYAVGLGNLWRFPYLCYANGGGAFLIPYVIMLVVVGMPMFLVELSLGQYASQGCIGVWKCCPLFKGLGYAMVIASSLLAIYYNVIMCWSVYYTYASFTALPSLPWVGCKNHWNTDNCYDDRDVNATMPANNTNITSASEEYFTIYVLKQSSGIEETGSIVWALTLCLILAWIVTIIALVKGVKSLGKIEYFTALFPYLVLIAVIARGATLPGASNGIRFYLYPDWERLRTAQVWKDAATQIFFSLGISNGGLHMASSYNKFHNNLVLDAAIIPLLNCGTSVFAGFAVFSVLGFMAHETNRAVDEVVASEIGLTFIAYPEALSRIPISPLWAILFFIMLMSLGVGSLVVIVEAVITAIIDEFAFIRKAIKGRRWIMPLTICTVFFVLGIPHVTQAGIYWLALQNSYAAGLSVLLIGFIELLVVTYIYGFRNVIKNVKVMVGSSSQVFVVLLYIVFIIPMFVAPFLIAFIVVFSLMDYTPITLGSYEYPYWADPVVAWLMVMASVGAIFIYMVYHLALRESGSIIERLKNSLKPLPEWGPMLQKHRKEAGISDYQPEDYDGHI